MLSTNPEVNPFGIPEPSKKAAADSAMGQAGMFGAMPKWKTVVLAGIAGLMARRNPQLAQSIMGNLSEMGEAEKRAAMYQQQRQDKFADWRQQYDYELGHPKPGTGTEFERLLEAGGIAPGTPEYGTHIKKRLDAIENPPYFYTDPTTGQTMMMPRNMGPQGPVGKLTPIDEGGAGPQAPRPFPY